MNDKGYYKNSVIDKNLVVEFSCAIDSTTNLDRYFYDGSSVTIITPDVNSINLLDFSFKMIETNLNVDIDIILLKIKSLGKITFDLPFISDTSVQTKI